MLLLFFLFFVELFILVLLREIYEDSRFGVVKSVEIRKGAYWKFFRVDFVIYDRL